MKRIALALGLVLVLALVGAAVGAMAGRSTARKTTVRVTEREYRISLSTKTLPTGTVRLVVHNAGKIPHRLSISGPGLSARTTPVIMPGATRGLTLTLRAGSFTLWCPLGRHASLGMKTTLTMRGPVAGPMPTSPNPTPGYSGGGGY